MKTISVIPDTNPLIPVKKKRTTAGISLAEDSNWESHHHSCKNLTTWYCAQCHEHKPSPHQPIIYVIDPHPTTSVDSTVTKPNEGRNNKTINTRKIKNGGYGRKVPIFRIGVFPSWKIGIRENSEQI